MCCLPKLSSFIQLQNEFAVQQPKKVALLLEGGNTVIKHFFNAPKLEPQFSGLGDVEVVILWVEVLKSGREIDQEGNE